MCGHRASPLRWMGKAAVLGLGVYAVQDYIVKRALEQATAGTGNHGDGNGTAPS